MARRSQRRDKHARHSKISPQQLATLTQQAGTVSSWLLDLQTGHLTWSAETFELMGIDPGEFDGRYTTWLQAVHPDDRDWVNRAVTRAIEYNKPYDAEFRIVRPDGEVCWIRAKGQVVVDGRRQWFAGIALDVTRRRLAEETLRKSERLASLGLMSAAMAHEITGALETATNLLYLLRKCPLDVTSRKYLETLEAQLAQVSHIARQNLAFCRENSEPVSAELGAIIREVVEAYRNEAASKQVTLQEKFPGGLNIQCYPVELRQLFSNLLRNALQSGATAAGIHAFVSREWQFPWREGVRVIVFDNGKGIPPHVQKKIFDPFFTTKGEQGNGLGLWVCSSIARKHQSSIRVRSSLRPGRTGSYFSIFLPHELQLGTGKVMAQEHADAAHGRLSSKAA